MRFTTTSAGKRRQSELALAGILLSLGVMPGSAQQVTGALGSPTATTTIPGNQLPPPDPKFQGVINEEYTQSTPWWPPRVVPPKGAPNVLLLMTDDQGFGVTSTFGGVIPTPTLDRVAAMGLRYTQMHSTALSSPTRAALITGRNHHSAGFGVVTEIATGYPGYDSILPKNKATIGTILKNNGYATSWFGKDHNTPMFTVGASGPFDQWPSGMGFDYFYGFVAGETDQWTPFLFRNHTQIFPWRDEGDFNLTTAMADEAVGYLRQINAESPDQPFLLYYAPGGTHAPHQPTKEWIDKISTMHLFDKGWNDLRDTIFANQKRLGIVPANTQLTPWPDSGVGKLPRWDTLTPEQKKLYVKEADVFAAYVAYTDHEIGRVIQEIEKQGKLDNTLIIYIAGDNGTSAEGTLTGTFNDLIGYNGVTEVPMAANMAHYDDWGMPGTAPHMAVPWAWAFDTPFQWTKQIASHFGGTRQGMAISWPAVIKDKGGIRTQFSHVIDVVPTILEATKVQTPKEVNGIAQAPIEGVSLMYTFEQANANVPTRHKTQYFEMGSYRGIYQDGWYANTTPPISPWSPVLDINLPLPLAYKWELYNLNEDYSQSNDLAAKQPDKLKDMQKIFTREASKYDVFPLDNRAFVRSLQARPSATAGVIEFTYTGKISGISPGEAPPVLGRSFTIAADIDVPQGGAEGMLVTDGGETGGYGLYLLRGTPVFTYNLLALELFRWQGPAALPPGRHTVVFDFTYDGPGLAKGGTGILRVDGVNVDTKKIPRTIPFIYLISETFDVGLDTRTGVNDADYRLPFRFMGTINKITLKPGPEQFTEGDRKVAQQTLNAARD